MRKIGFALAFLSAVSMTVLPVAPSFAAQATPAAPGLSAEQTLAKHARRGDVFVLSQGQMSRLAVTNPALHAKVWKAYQTGTVPKLTVAEKKMLQATTARNIDSIQAAGWTTATIWIVVIASVLLVALLWQPVFCKLWPWAIGCAPVRVR